MTETQTTPPEPAAFHLNLLDAFSLTSHGDAIDLPLSAQRVLVFLALRDRPVGRSFVAGSLWPEKSENRANGNLRAALWRLGEPGAVLVERLTTQVRLSPDIRVDVHDAVTSARRILATASPLDPVDLDWSRLSRDILPGWYEDWLVLARERLRQLRLHALETLCVRLIGTGRVAQAIQVGEAVVELEPLRDSGQRALFAAHLAEGNRAEALHQYERYRAVLWDTLRLAPSFTIETMLAGLGPTT